MWRIVLTKHLQLQQEPQRLSRLGATHCSACFSAESFTYLRLWTHMYAYLQSLRRWLPHVRKVLVLVSLSVVWLTSVRLLGSSLTPLGRLGCGGACSKGWVAPPGCNSYSDHRMSQPGNCLWIFVMLGYEISLAPDKLTALLIVLRSFFIQFPFLYSIHFWSIL